MYSYMTFDRIRIRLTVLVVPSVSLSVGSCHCVMMAWIVKWLGVEEGEREEGEEEEEEEMTAESVVCERRQGDLSHPTRLLTGGGGM